MSTKALILTVASASFIFVALIFVTYTTYPTMMAFGPSKTIGANQVILKAKSWNDGKVHVWQSIVESEATFINVPDGTRCERLDNQTHKLIGPPPPIFYYHVDCGGVIGYVEVDQVR